MYYENKKTFIDKFLSLVGKNKLEQVKTDSNQFSHFLSEVKKNTNQYNIVTSVVDLCNSSLNFYAKKMSLIDRIESINNRMVEIESFNNLTDEETDTLKKYLDRFAIISKEKNVLNEQLSSFPHNLSYLIELEEEAKQALPQIQDAENKQRILKNDLGQIEGEKADLEYEKIVAEKSLIFIYYFTAFLLFAFVLITSFITYSYLTIGNNVFYPTTVLICGVLFFMLALFVLRRRAKFELTLNIKKQKRAIELLNKKNIVYAYYTNFLNFEYQKYKVKSSENLIKNLKELNSYMYISNRYDNIRKIMYKIEEDIESFVKYKNLVPANTSVAKFSENIGLEHKKTYYKELETERQALENNLANLEGELDGIWNKIISYNNKDKSDDSIISRIIQHYYDIINSNTFYTNFDESIDKQSFIV